MGGTKTGRGPYRPTPPSGMGGQPTRSKAEANQPSPAFQPAQEFLGHLPFQPNPQKLRNQHPNRKVSVKQTYVQSSPQPSPQPSLASPARQPAQQPNHPASQLASPATPPAQPASPARPARAHAKSKAKKRNFRSKFGQNFRSKRFAQHPGPKPYTISINPKP